ncbi:MAG: LL-diaminopimelate aminotransferase [Deltaproteobacteria bacterium]|nr:LL-diaminopimelate aminotransferase [Deltaproteobacteria bacterium]
MRPASRIEQLPAYLFADLDRKRRAAEQRGLDVISLSIGDPDLPTPEPIVEAARAALADPSLHRYPDYAGSARFRQACADWLEMRFGQRFDPQREILGLIGSKEGIAHLPLAVCNPGDVLLCPEPGYPVYAAAAQLAGAEVHALALRAERGFLPDLDAVPAGICGRARALWINYPHNPTGAVAGLDFYARAVDFCARHELVLCADAAYSEIGFEGYRASSVFEVPGAREVAVEFHSMSKTFNMTGWRIAFVAGRPDVIAPLGALKSNLDSGPFGVVQAAAVAALELGPGPRDAVCEVYQRRRDRLVEGLRAAGLAPSCPRATFYVWVPVPGGDDVGFAARLVEQLGVLVAPGSGFGPSGAGYVRFSLTVADSRLDEAVERLEKLAL